MKQGHVTRSLLLGLGSIVGQKCERSLGFYTVLQALSVFLKLCMGSSKKIQSRQWELMSSKP